MKSSVKRKSVTIRFFVLSALISLGLLYAACEPPPEKAPEKFGFTEKRSIEKKNPVRVKHLSGEVLAVNSKTNTMIVRFKNKDMKLRIEDGTIVKIDLCSVSPYEIPPGTWATVKYVERKGLYVAKGIFISTETAVKKEGSPQSFDRDSAKQSCRSPWDLPIFAV